MYQRLKHYKVLKFYDKHTLAYQCTDLYRFLRNPMSITDLQHQDLIIHMSIIDLLRQATGSSFSMIVSTRFSFIIPNHRFTIRSARSTFIISQLLSPLSQWQDLQALYSLSSCQSQIYHVKLLFLSVSATKVFPRSILIIPMSIIDLLRPAT